MQRPLQITFKGIDSSPQWEAAVRRRARELERLYPRITGCRVVVEVPHRGAESTKVPLGVLVEVDVPARNVIVGKDVGEPHEARGDQFAPLNNAFDAVERQLRRIADILDREVKSEAAPQSGMVVRLDPEERYGFVEIDNSPELYFAPGAVAGGSFAELAVGMLVDVTPAREEGPMGPQASSVRLRDRNKAPT